MTAAWVRGQGPARTHPIAFFDVDETLLAGKSMLEFLRFHLARRGHGESYERVVAGMRGAGRAEANRRYYTAYAGVSWTDLLAEGREWYAEWCRRPAAFLSGGLAALRRHQGRGDAVVLVSGSFLPCLGPLAEHLGADAVLCGEPEVDRAGVVTGRIAEPMIGRAKAQAAQRLAADRRVAPADCYAYGDHPSDLDLLTSVGNPAVVGADPVVRRFAEGAGWPHWPAEPVPAPPPRPPLSTQDNDCYCGCALATWSIPRSRR